MSHDNKKQCINAFLINYKPTPICCCNSAILLARIASSSSSAILKMRFHHVFSEIHMSTVNLGSSPGKNEGGPNSTRQQVNPRWGSHRDVCQRSCSLAIHSLVKTRVWMSGACPGFLKGGGSNISWFPKKKVIRF